MLRNIQAEDRKFVSYKKRVDTFGEDVSRIRGK